MQHGWDYHQTQPMGVPYADPADSYDRSAEGAEGALNRDGFERVSRRVFVVPPEATPATIIEELNSVHGMGVQEKSACIRLDPCTWTDEAEFSAAVNKAFKVKGGKAGAKFWKGVREAVMKQCTTQDLLVLVPDLGTTSADQADLAADQVNSLLKNVFEAADTKAAADAILSLKSGKLLAVLHGWPTDEVRLRPGRRAALRARGLRQRHRSRRSSCFTS